MATDPNWRRRPKWWTEQRRQRCIELLEQGYSDRRIGKALGCSENAVNIYVDRKLGGHRKWRPLTAREVARRLGVESKCVVWWRAQGWLTGRQMSGYNSHWVFEEDDVLAFLENPEHWHRWSPERIDHENWGEWACELRSGDDWLTTGELGRRLGYTSNAVQQWIARGLLPAVKHQNNWRVRASDLAGFVPPSERARGGRPCRRFKPAEDARLLALRADGQTWPAIAAALGRAVSSVEGRVRRLETQRRERGQTA